MIADTALLTWQQVGQMLNRRRWWVLTHANEIGAVRGANGRLHGFRPSDVDAWIARHVVVETPAAKPVASAPTPITSRRQWPTEAEVAAFNGRTTRRAGR